MKKLLAVLMIQLFFIAVSLINSKTIFGFPTVYPTGTTIYKPDKTHDGYTLFKKQFSEQSIINRYAGKCCPLLSLNLVLMERLYGNT